MSVFCATLTADAAVVTVDSVITWPEKTMPDLAEYMGEQTEKLWIVPSRQFVVSNVGAVGAMMHIGLTMGPATACDVEALASHMPELCRNMMQAALLDIPSADQQPIVLLAGCTAAGGPCLYIFQPPDYAATAMQVGSHTLMPAPSPTAPGYDDVLARWAPAGTGQGIEDFHLAVLKNAAGQFPGGRTPAGIAFGGKLVSARVDKAGILTRVIGELPMP